MERHEARNHEESVPVRAIGGSYSRLRAGIRPACGLLVEGGLERLQGGIAAEGSAKPTPTGLLALMLDLCPRQIAKGVSGGYGQATTQTDALHLAIQTITVLETRS